MAKKGDGLRLAAGLWFLTALLALSATAYRYSTGAEVRWYVALLGLAAIFMGFNALQRARKADAEDVGQSPAP